MRDRTHTTEESAFEYGFRWGPLDVARHMVYRGTHSVGILTDHGSVEVYVSKTGRSIRVFKDGRELK